MESLSLTKYLEKLRRQHSKQTSQPELFYKNTTQADKLKKKLLALELDCNQCRLWQKDTTKQEQKIAHIKEQLRANSEQEDITKRSQ